MANSMEHPIIEALRRLRPGAEWGLRGPDYEQLTWLDANQSKPTKAEVTAELRKIAKEKKA